MSKRVIGSCLPYLSLGCLSIQRTQLKEYMATPIQLSAGAIEASLTDQIGVAAVERHQDCKIENVMLDRKSLNIFAF